MNTFSQKITLIQAEKLKQLYKSKGAVFDTVQYAVWRAKTSFFQAIYYNSGKLLIQGKNIDNISAETEKILGIKKNNIEVKSIFAETKHASSINADFVSNSPSDTLNNAVSDSIFEVREDKYIGTDESGKGDFFGPLVAAGVQADNINKKKFADLGVKDSKKLDDKKILILSDYIKANSTHSIIVITPKKYNELYSKFNNLNKLLAWAHARAIENILEKSNCNYALADKFGDESLIKNALMTKGKNIVLKQMVRAEADIAVAAASILARAEFVKRMKQMETKYELSFSKGVSKQVVEQAKSFVKKYSFERLDEVAKLHFKTINEIK